MLGVGVLVIVGDADDFRPIAAVAVGDFNNPSPTAAGAAAIAERDPGRDGGEVVGLLARCELQARGTRL
jgi:hypothetical protein